MTAKKNIKFFIVSVFFILTLSVVLIYGSNNGWYGKNKVGFESELDGVTIGESKSDVLFSIGKGFGFTEKSGVSVMVYSAEKSELLKYVFFDKNNKVFYILILCDVRNNIFNKFDWTGRLKWISSSVEKNKIIERLGVPTQIVEADEGMSRAYRYSKNNLQILFYKSEFLGIGVGDVSRLEFDYPTSSYLSSNLRGIFAVRAIH